MRQDLTSTPSSYLFSVRNIGCRDSSPSGIAPSRKNFAATRRNLGFEILFRRRPLAGLHSAGEERSHNHGVHVKRLDTRMRRARFMFQFAINERDRLVTVSFAYLCSPSREGDSKVPVDVSIHRE
jgi:hypothetical protein